MRSLLGRWSLPSALLTAGLVLGTLAVPVATAAEDGATPPEQSTAAAAAALDEVQELVAPAPAQTGDRARVAAPMTGKGRDLTMALRDLRMRQDDLSASDQRTAARLLARPSATACRTFGGRVAVHYTTSGTDASTSAWVDNVGGTVLSVLNKYAGAGYRAPESDGTRGNATGCATGSYLDIYLSNLGSQRLYGYCDTDTPPGDPVTGAGPYDTSAYCAFDNNYAEFPAQTPSDNLRVTAAHELFHAVQFAYDYYEDAWFMESTAAWAEDEVYDSINDNRQYLAYSPARRPGVPIDSGAGLHVYGSWLFIRYLSERFPQQVGGMPVVVRNLFDRVDGAAGGRDAYSLQAIAAELRARKSTLRAFVARFADANGHPKRSYSEGASYPRTRAAKAFRLSKARRDTRWRSVRRDHLTSATIAILPGAGLRAGSRLRVDVNMPNTSRGSVAIVTAFLRNGKLASKYVRLSRAGNGHTTLGFGARKVSRVNVVLSNGGNHFRCYQRTEFSCQGQPLDDRRTLSYRVRLLR